VSKRVAPGSVHPPAAAVGGVAGSVPRTTYRQ